MLVKQIMTTNVKTILADSTVKKAAEIMKKEAIGILPVNELAESNFVAQVIGMITDKDIVWRVVAEGKDSNQIKVGQVMTPGVLCCHETEPLERAADIMVEKGIHHLLVVNKNERVTGILSRGDLAASTKSTEITEKVFKRASSHVKPE